MFRADYDAAPTTVLAFDHGWAEDSHRRDYERRELQEGALKTWI